MVPFLAEIEASKCSYTVERMKSIGRRIKADYKNGQVSNPAF